MKRKDKFGKVVARTYTLNASDLRQAIVEYVQRNSMYKEPIKADDTIYSFDYEVTDSGDVIEAHYTEQYTDEIVERNV